MKGKNTVSVNPSKEKHFFDFETLQHWNFDFSMLFDAISSTVIRKIQLFGIPIIQFYQIFKAEIIISNIVKWIQMIYLPIFKMIYLLFNANKEVNIMQNCLYFNEEDRVDGESAFKGFTYVLLCSALVESTDFILNDILYLSAFELFRNAYHLSIVINLLLTLCCKSSFFLSVSETE